MEALTTEELRIILRNRGVPFNETDDRNVLLSRLSAPAGGDFQRGPTVPGPGPVPTDYRSAPQTAGPPPTSQTGPYSTGMGSTAPPAGKQKGFSDPKTAFNQLKMWVTEGMDDVSAALAQLWESGATYLDNAHQRMVRDRYTLSESERVFDEHRCKVVSGYTVISGVSHITNNFFCFSGWFGKNLRVVLPLRSITQIHRGTAETVSNDLPPMFRASALPERSNNAIQLFTNDGRVHMFFDPTGRRFEEWYQCLESSWLRVQTYGDSLNKETPSGSPYTYQPTQHWSGSPAQSVPQSAAGYPQPQQPHPSVSPPQQPTAPFGSPQQQTASFGSSQQQPMTYTPGHTSTNP